MTVSVVYREHAVTRMIERRLMPSEVEHVLKFSDGEIPQSKDKVIFYKKIRNRTDNLIAVVAIKADTKIEVITVLVNFEVNHGP